MERCNCRKRGRAKQGFTLAELLIVVAIIAVLAAISIPVFSSQLNRSKYASDEANARSIYALMSADYLANGGTKKSDGFSVSPTEAKSATTVTVKEPDGTENKFSFNGVAKVTFHEATVSSAPWVEIDEDHKYNSGVVTFGSSSGGGGETPITESGQGN